MFTRPGKRASSLPLIAVIFLSGTALFPGLPVFSGSAVAGSIEEPPPRPRKSLFGEGLKLNFFGLGSRKDTPNEPPPLTSKNKTATPVLSEPEAVSDKAPETAANFIYAAPEMVPLFGAALTPPRSGDGVKMAIYEALSDSATKVRVRTPDRAAVLAYYAEKGFTPLWVGENGLTARGLELVSFLGHADEDGLDPADYLPAALRAVGQDGAIVSTDPRELAHTELTLTASAMLYARHASSGALDPAKLSRSYDLKPESADPFLTLLALDWLPSPSWYLAGLQPHHRAYSAFKKALAALHDLPDGADPALEISAGKRVKVNQSDPRVVSVRARLERLGYVSTRVEASESAEAELANASIDNFDDPEKLDLVLADAIMDFQASVGLKVTGAIDNPTIAALNGKGDKNRRERLIFNMERLRWMPKFLGTRHIFVNLPSYQLVLMNAGEEEWRTNIIIGKPNTQTVSFSDQMETVVFHPYWGVPQSIIVNEYLPILRRDPGYLDRKGYVVASNSGTVMRSSSVNWNAFGKRVPLSIQQKPGNSNALGELKFLFPNAHDIYMHDTPTRNLFAQKVRAFSHGCVRVENPRELAQLVLNMDAEEVAAQLDKPGTAHVRLSRPLPVHISYFTAWPDAAGTITYYDDIYGRDARMEKLMGKNRLPGAVSETE